MYDQDLDIQMKWKITKVNVKKSGIQLISKNDDTRLL